MGLLDEIRKALESEKTSEFIDQILKEKSLHNALHDAGYSIVVDDPQARGMQRPFGVLSKVQKIDLIDLIELINRIKLIDEITLISTISTVGSMTLLDRINQIDKIHPDTSLNGEQMTNGDFETGDLTGYTSGGTVIVDTGGKHTGVYGCLLDDYPILPWIEQDIATLKGASIPVDGMISFSLWALMDSGTGAFTVIITYSDATTTSIPLVATAVYQQFNLLPYLTAGKQVSKIKIQTTNTGMSFKVWFDDISLLYEGAHTVIDRVKVIDAMPAITGSVSVTGSEAQLLLQRALTYDLIVQLRSAGVEIDPRAIRALTAADIVTVNNLLNPHPVSLASIPNPPNLDVALSTRALESGGNLAAILAQLDSKTSTLFKATQNIGNTSFGATQATRTNLKTQPEREDIVSLGGVASPSAAGVQIVAASGSLVPKVYDAEYEGLADGLHYFYFGTSTTPTTKRFLSRKTKGVNSKTFVQPRVGDAGDGIYLYSSVAETNMPYDLGYKLE